MLIWISLCAIPAHSVFCLLNTKCASIQLFMFLLFQILTPCRQACTKEAYPFPTLALEDHLQLFSFTSCSYTLVIKHLASQVSLNLTQPFSPFLETYLHLIKWLTKLHTQILQNNYLILNKRRHETIETIFAISS